MARTYRQLTAEEREEVSRVLAGGGSRAEAARAIGRHRSTVGRELRRSQAVPTTYRAAAAHHAALLRSRIARKPRTMDGDQRLRSYVFTHLRLWWSPEQISTRLREEYPQDTTMRISPETIYPSLYVLPKKNLRKELLTYLRQRHLARRKRKGTPELRGKIPAMISISDRPSDVATRLVPGHWEGDLIIGRGNRSALGTLVERTTRTTLLVPLKAKDAAAVRRAFARTMRTLPEQMARSLTYDQGKEMAEHEQFTADTRIQVYFAHPHSPWERGTNENTNGLVRQFFPKGTDFSTVSRRQVQRVQDLLNGRPRKILHWRTPIEAFHEAITSFPVALGS